MGFGVVWWSIATILTPIAAKIGLPFLLLVRACMGVGEVSFFTCYAFVINAFWDPYNS